MRHAESQFSHWRCGENPHSKSKNRRRLLDSGYRPTED